MKILACLTLILTFSIFAFSQQKVGEDAQNFTGVNMNDETVELEKLKGKVVILTFWSTRCQICIAEIPKLNKLVDKYKGEEVAFSWLNYEQQKNG